LVRVREHVFVPRRWNDSPFNIYPVKGRYLWRDLERICAADRIPLRRHRSSRATGCSPLASLRALPMRPGSVGLRTQTDEAIRLGIFGSPTFVVGEELFWGNDRLEDALRWANAPQ